MKRILLIELLEKFSEKEMKNLGHLINCSYFNTDIYVVKLFNQLKTNIIENKNDFDEAEQAVVYQAVFNSKENCSKSQHPKHPKTINKKEKANLSAKISALTRLAEQFLKIEQLRKDEAMQYNFLQKALIEKNQERLSIQTIKKAEKKLMQIPKGLGYYKYKKVLAESKTDYAFNFVGQNLSLKKILHLKQCINEHYLIMQLGLQLIEDSVYNASVQKKEDNIVDFDIKYFLEISHFVNLPLVQIYSKAFEFLKYNKKKDYHTFLKLLDDESKDIDKDLLKDLYLTALNFCTKQIKQGKISYYQNQFEIYKTLDEKDLLLSDNQININGLKNLVNVSCRVTQSTWAKEMLDKYYPYLRNDIQADVRNYNLGLICFYQKKYQPAIDYLFPLGNINLAY